jgi:pilus assembly protein CpaD
MAHMSTRYEMTSRRESEGVATPRESLLGRPGARALALALILPLGACGVNRTLPPPDIAHDYHDRHPVVLADAEHTVDIFPPVATGRIDNSTTARVRDFVARYRRVGHGQITLLAPIGGPDGATSRQGVAEVRRALAANGVSGSVYVGTYPVSDPSLAAPVRLSFRGIKAKTANRCGDWPADLASGASLEGWQNQSYWNFGCANQTTLAAQVADPRDLVSPRGETASDIEMRMRGINKVRQGVDPTTQWVTKQSAISSVGAN